MEFKRKCSKCDKFIFYKTEQGLLNAIKRNPNGLCHSCKQAGKIAWNKNKTYEECYGFNKAEEIRKKVAHKGKENGMYGKKHKKSSKEKISFTRKKNISEGQIIPWNKNKKFPGMFINKNRTGKDNAFIKYILKKENITYEEYKKKYLSDKKEYYNNVIRITNMQPVYFLENYERRGIKKYHLDHIYPISKGFKNKIPPELIGNINNLQFIWWEDNLKKSNKIGEEYDNNKNIIFNRK